MKVCFCFFIYPVIKFKSYIILNLMLEMNNIDKTLLDHNRYAIYKLRHYDKEFKEACHTVIYKYRFK